MMPHGARGAIIRCAPKGDAPMRTLLIAAITAGLIVPVGAQGMGGSKRHRGQATKTETAKPKVDEKGYNASLSRNPTPAKKYDPWDSKR